MYAKDRSGTVKIWKTLFPKDAYMAGFNDAAGSIFLPTESNAESVRSELDRLWNDTQDITERSFIRWARYSLEYREPQTGPEEILWAAFAHLLKEGVVPRHLGPLMIAGGSLIRADLERFRGSKHPVELRILVQNTVEAVRTILGNMEPHGELSEPVDSLRGALDDYSASFAVDGMKGSDYRSLKSVLEIEAGSIGREKIYPRILREVYNLVVSPQQLEERALLWLYSEIPLLKGSCRELSFRYGSDPGVESVGSAVNEARTIDPSRLFESIGEMRSTLHPYISSEVVEITPGYDTRIMETPPYLSPFIPTGSVSSFDGFTDSPFNVIFISKDPMRTPPVTLPELFLVLVHEEFGHCVNFSNAFGGVFSQPADVELITTPMMLPISDGMSIHREWEVYSRIREIQARSPSDMKPHERALHEFVDGHYPFGDFADDLEYIVRKWRVIRYLRAVADIRINLGKQNLLDFIHWARITTGLPESMIFDQIFVTIGMPGYAPAFVSLGERIREIQDIRINHGIGRRKFNRFASSMGFPCRQIFESRLANFG
ncbi:MAG: hypothetical protein ACMUIG_04805 [Thermoplasmatota archaeon]